MRTLTKEDREYVQQGRVPHCTQCGKRADIMDGAQIGIPGDLVFIPHMLCLGAAVEWVPSPGPTPGRSRCKIKVTVTKIFEAEFDDVLAASEMIKHLERDPNPTTINGQTAGRWKISATEQQRSVQVLDDRKVF